MDRHSVDRNMIVPEKWKMEYFLGNANLGSHNNKNTLFNIMLIILRIKLTLSAAYELDFLISPDWGSIAELPSRIKSSISVYKYGDY